MDYDCIYALILKKDFLFLLFIEDGVKYIKT